MKRYLGIAIAVLAIGGCTAAPATKPSAAPKPSPTAASVPDPIPTDLPVGAKVLVRQDGAGAAVLPTPDWGAAKTVLVRWSCSGKGGVRVGDEAKPMAYSGGCDPGVFYTASMSIAKAKTVKAWRIGAAPAVRWRLAIVAE